MPCKNINLNFTQDSHYQVSKCIEFHLAHFSLSNTVGKISNFLSLLYNKMTWIPLKEKRKEKKPWC